MASTEFQNTIAYGTFFSGGGVFTVDAGNYESFLFTPSPELTKNVSVYETGKFRVQVEQKGMYWIEFSFVAGSGDGKTYYVQPYVNDGKYLPATQDMSIRFYQQPTTQEYEVSTHGLFSLKENDFFEYKLFAPATPSALDLYTKSIRMNIINLQQLGIH